ncbi:MAG: substrate-binding domain-containing protein [Bacillus subtilis]|nr:substrate-binding domain-containing protein [Bacillus subtilis]
MIDYDLEIPTNRDFGYIQAFEEMGLVYDPRNILRLSPVADYASSIKTTLDEIKPTAIIPVSSVFASATISHLKHAGLRIKDDVSIIVYDDVSYAEFLDLTVISHPLQEIAETAANMVFERINHFDSNPVHRQIKPFLLKRNSVRKIG